MAPTPPRKPPTRENTRKNLAAPTSASPSSGGGGSHDVGAAVPTERARVASPALPESNSVAPLWTPSSSPRALFPLWNGGSHERGSVPSSSSSPSSTGELAFEDEAFDRQAACPTAVAWKRPSELLPPIPSDSPPLTGSNSTTALPPVVADAKHTRKAGATPSTPAKKTGEASDGAKHTASSAAATTNAAAVMRHAHIVYVAPPVGQAVPAVALSVASPALSSAGGDGKKTVGDRKATITAPLTSQPATPSAASASAQGGTGERSNAPPPRRLVRDFRRLWSPEQEEGLMRWRAEEMRIEREREQRERVYLAFEDATAFIINDRPRGAYDDTVVDPEDLVDDGEEEGEDEEPDADGSKEEEHGDSDGHLRGGGGDSSPYGVLPPPRIEIAANAVTKPEVPHGSVVQADMASYFRIVDQMHQLWASTSMVPSSSSPSLPPASHPVGAESASTNTTSEPPPYLWEAIYPQDVHGVPTYNAAGRYAVRLFVMGAWRCVEVDDRLPVDDEGDILLVSSSMKNEIWPVILAKAVLKVVHWLGVVANTSLGETRSDQDHATGTVQLASTVISTLTGWKVTRLDSLITSPPSSFVGYHSLLSMFIPEDQSDSVQNELILDSEHAAGAQPTVFKPRALVCCSNPNGIPSLSFREAAVIHDVVGDAGNMTLKVVNLNGIASLPEESLNCGRTTFLLVHPPPTHSDTVLVSWHKAQDSDAQVPFSNPPLQLCEIRMPLLITSTQRPADDSAVEAIRDSPLAADPDSLRFCGPQLAESVDVVVTLTRVSSASTDITADSSSMKLAQSLNVDPSGSVILVEQMGWHTPTGSASPPARPPMIFKLDMTSAMHLRFPRGPHDSFVFRAYPQSSCRYGYALQVESHCPVNWQTPCAFWRNSPGLHVVEGDGAYPVLLAGSWNVLFKKNIELTAPSDAKLDKPELYVDLLISDADLVPYVRLTLVNNATNEVVPLAGLYARVTLSSDSLRYTLVAECTAPCDATVPEGAWHLALASTLAFKHATAHQPRRTQFAGVYVPNKPLLCFRDVVTHPRKTSATSIQLQLLRGLDKEADMVVCEDLAVKLEVFDLATEQLLLCERSNVGMLRLLQLPPFTRASNDPHDEKSGYILQGSIDADHCVVSDSLRSVRPFRNGTSPPPAALPAKVAEAAGTEESNNKEPLEEGHSNGIETPSISANATTSSSPVSEENTASHHVNWKLTCWSTEEVTLEFDRGQERRFDAVRASWAESAVERDTSGAASRQLFLQNGDAANAALQEEARTEEQSTRIKTRFDWIANVLANAPSVDGANGNSYLHQLQDDPTGRHGVLREPEANAQDEQTTREAMEAVAAALQVRRDARNAAKETRALELQEFIQSVKARREQVMVRRRELYAARDALLRECDNKSEVRSTSS